MENNLSKLQEKAVNLLDEAQEMVLHKEKRSDQEGNIEVRRRVRVDSREKAREKLIEFYNDAGKRDKVFVEKIPSALTESSDGPVWEIRYQTRHYINK